MFVETCGSSWHVILSYLAWIVPVMFCFLSGSFLWNSFFYFLCGDSWGWKWRLALVSHCQFLPCSCSQTALPLCQRGARLVSGDVVQLGDAATDDRQEPRQIILVGPNNFIGHTFLRIIWEWKNDEFLTLLGLSYILIYHMIIYSILA